MRPAIVFGARGWVRVSGVRASVLRAATRSLALTQDTSAQDYANALARALCAHEVPVYVALVRG